MQRAYETKETICHFYRWDNHNRLSCVRSWSQSQNPIKIHVWGGISRKGAILIVIFTGTLICYSIILDRNLKPFIERAFPDKNYWFQKDNDLKHVTNYSFCDKHLQRAPIKIQNFLKPSTCVFTRDHLLINTLNYNVIIPRYSPQMQW